MIYETVKGWAGGLGRERDSYKPGHQLVCPYIAGYLFISIREAAAVTGDFQTPVQASQSVRPVNIISS